MTWKWPSLKSKDDEIIEKILRFVKDSAGRRLTGYNIEQYARENFVIDTLRFNRLFRVMIDKNLVFALDEPAYIYEANGEVPIQQLGSYFDITTAGIKYLSTPWLFKKMSEHKDEILLAGTVLSSSAAIISALVALSSKIVFIINGSR